MASIEVSRLQRSSILADAAWEVVASALYRCLQGRGYAIIEPSVSAVSVLRQAASSVGHWRQHLDPDERMELDVDAEAAVRSGEDSSVRLYSTEDGHTGVALRAAQDRMAGVPKRVSCTALQAIEAADSLCRDLVSAMLRAAPSGVRSAGSVLNLLDDLPLTAKSMSSSVLDVQRSEPWRAPLLVRATSSRDVMVIVVAVDNPDAKFLVSQFWLGHAGPHTGGECSRIASKCANMLSRKLQTKACMRMCMHARAHTHTHIRPPVHVHYMSHHHTCILVFAALTADQTPWFSASHCDTGPPTAAASAWGSTGCSSGWHTGQREC